MTVFVSVLQLLEAFQGTPLAEADKLMAVMRSSKSTATSSRASSVCSTATRSAPAPKTVAKDGAGAVGAGLHADSEEHEAGKKAAPKEATKDVSKEMCKGEEGAQQTVGGGGDPAGPTGGKEQEHPAGRNSAEAGGVGAEAAEAVAAPTATVVEVPTVGPPSKPHKGAHAAKAKASAAGAGSATATAEEAVKAKASAKSEAKSSTGGSKRPGSKTGKD